ncbi:MAG: hypothetical protein RL417_745, partial [Pseudomonadota bacterium]
NRVWGGGAISTPYLDWLFSCPES